MRRLPRVALVTTAVILLLCALVLSGLRFLLPNIDNYRQDLIDYVEKKTDVAVQIGKIEGAWQSFGPVLTLSDVVLQNKTTDITANTITVELDIWSSLFSLRWRFRDLTFYQLNVDHKVPFSLGDSSEGQSLDGIEELFLRQFDHFVLKESQLTFLTPSEQKTTLILPELSWLNDNDRHRAQGFVSLETINKQHGYLQVKLDVSDKNGVLSDGIFYLQADNIDMQPWLSRWLRDNTSLRDANFSLSSWVTLKNNRIDSGLIQLRQGEANWGAGELAQNLQVNDLLLRMKRQGNGWLFNIPELDTLKTNEFIWPRGSASVLYLPASKKYQDNDHWRIRAKDIELERLSEILPTFSFLTPEMVQDWQHRQPTGVVSEFALDITQNMPENVQINMDWQNVSWKKWKELPSVNHFSGVLIGGMQSGSATVSLQDSEVDYRDEFKAPFSIKTATGQFHWVNNASEFKLWSPSLELQAQSLWANGEFRYAKAKKGNYADLAILAGIRLDDAGDAWRYFPQKLMGQDVADYLTKAIIAGSVDNATLVYKGDPAHFPYDNNDGQFQVYVPLRDATFEYDSEWPALLNLDMDLDFRRAGLYMHAPSVKLADATATNLDANIPDYTKEMLYINADISGTGKQIQQYFVHTPMNHSIGDTLEELQIGGTVNGQLGLSIPLVAGKDVFAKGKVNLNKNDLYIQPIDSTISALTGSFEFNNGDLRGENLQGHWFEQPITVDFTTTDQAKNYLLDVNVSGNWAVNKLAMLPAEIKQKVSGTTNWKSQVAITIPNTAKEPVGLQIDVSAGLKQLKSQLPAIDNALLAELGQINVQAKGTTEQLVVGGDIGKRIGFNTQWGLSSKPLSLLKAHVAQWRDGIPELPKNATFVVDLPPITDMNWEKLAGLLVSSHSREGGMSIGLPDMLEVNIPSIYLAGQQWNAVNFSYDLQRAEQLVSINSENLKGSLQIFASQPWQVAIDYLYYNPSESSSTQINDLATTQIDFSQWPQFQFHCKECWVAGQKLGEISANIQPKGTLLQLTDGTLDNSVTKLKLDAIWNSEKGNKTQIAGSLTGEAFDETAAYFGILVPIIQSPYTIEFDLNWANLPWSPDIASLNGKMSAKLGNGAIAQMGGGRAGQILRLVSFDALLRKLRFDFSDTFSDDFDFDSIKGDATIKNGVLVSKNTYVDGLVADIAFNGQIDLVKRQINVEAVITPEISATVGVATAFVVNPFAGAAVFAATKVLGPLWSKVSVIRYRVTGSLDEPKIDEVLRQLKETQE
ncbi:AsmA2 domain-containing protein YhdP [Providencia sp. PROV194]|uniref:AsmA2 domain-containing protein YhdP n=1 Tax=Providencia sp. PROV194 TaxID=2949895 RepID=UPI00234A0B0B|nr:AsmA2 domain-containing protein YhdP [Providencia sp. PROV194]